MNTQLSPQNVLSNVNEARLEQLLEIVKRTEMKKEFLQPNKKLLVIERNPEYLNKIIITELLPLFPFGCEKTTYDIKPTLPHHNELRMGLITKYNCNHEKKNKQRELFAPEQKITTSNGNIRPIKLISRTKGPDSSVEKIARVKGQNENIESEEYLGQLAVGDFYGMTIITENKDICYKLKDKISTISSFIIKDEIDYFKKPKESGYQSIHQYVRWENGIPELNQLQIELHYDTKISHFRNNVGDDQNSTRGHAHYGGEKVKKEHSLEGLQVVVVDHNTNPQDTNQFPFTHQHVDISNYVTGSVQYDLLRMKNQPS